MILDEELQLISPQEAKDRSFFGPVYHGSTSDKLEKISTQGFKTYGDELYSGGLHGYELMDYWAGIPAPVHHLGFGMYFTTTKSIAKKFAYGYGGQKIGPYFLDVPRLETINFASKKNMMNWWLANGYDYQRSPETTFASGHTDLLAVRKERTRATHHLTEVLKSKYDAVWFKGKGFRGHLLDGDQVVVFDSNKIYKLDKHLVKPGDIGSRVVLMVPIKRHSQEITAGTQGVIIDKRKVTPDQAEHFPGSDYLYAVAWDKFKITYDVTNKEIDLPTTISEEQIVRRDFWKAYEESHKINEGDGDVYEQYLPITKMEEDQVVSYIVQRYGSVLGKTLKKVRDTRKEKLGPTMEFDIIDYRAKVGESWVTFQIRKTNKGTGFSMHIERPTGKEEKRDWRKVISPEELTEAVNPRLGHCFELAGRYVQKHKDAILVHGSVKNPYVDNDKYPARVKNHAWIEEGNEVYDPVTDRRWTKEDFEEVYDPIVYKKYDQEHTLITLLKHSNWGPWHDEKPLNEALEEGVDDPEHADALRQTGYWGRQGAGAIILAKDTGRILLPYRSNLPPPWNMEQPHTWGVWGGAIDRGEDPAMAVKRELSEEVGMSVQIDELIPLYVYTDPRVGFRYSNFLAVVSHEFTPNLDRNTNENAWETERATWFPFGQWPQPLHFGLKALLDNSEEQIKAEAKKYYKPPQPMKGADREKFKASYEVLIRTWNVMFSMGEYEYRERFDYDDVVQWLLNEAPLHTLLEKYGQKFYPFDDEPSYTFLGDIEKTLEILEMRYNARMARKIDPTDPLFVLKKLVKGKSWERAKFDLNRLSLSGPMVSDNARISDEDAEIIFKRLFLVAMGETQYTEQSLHNTVPLSSITLTDDKKDFKNTFLKHYVPRMTRFPDMVKIFRGTNSPRSKIRPGDFTTFDKNYARSYIRGKYGAVIADTLPSKDLHVYKLDPNQSEMIYWPAGHQIRKYMGQIPTFKEFYTQNK